MRERLLQALEDSDRCSEDEIQVSVNNCYHCEKLYTSDFLSLAYLTTIWAMSKDSNLNVKSVELVGVCCQDVESHMNFLQTRF